jgi:hypothetical protein
VSEQAATAFQTAFERRDFAPAAEVLADDVEFRSPVLHRPWRTRAVLEQLGPAMMGVFAEMRFGPVASAGDRTFLPFTGRVGELDAEGVLVLDAPDGGPVTDMGILVRPLPALQAVAEAMGAALDPALLAAH